MSSSWIILLFKYVAQFFFKEILYSGGAKTHVRDLYKEAWTSVDLNKRMHTSLEVVEMYYESFFDFYILKLADAENLVWPYRGL